MKIISTLTLLATILFCALLPPTASAKYCNRAGTQYGSKDFTCGYNTSNCTFFNFDFRRHAVGTCIAGSCYDGQGTGWLNPGVYEGRFSNGYPDGDGVMHRGAPDSSGHFREALVLKGSFRAGCMYGDVNGTVPSSAIFWRGTYDEESNQSTGAWYLSVTNPGRNVPPLLLVSGGISAQPTEAFAAEALRNENGRVGSALSAKGGTSSSSGAAAPPTPPPPPVAAVFRNIANEKTIGPLPLTGNNDYDATSVSTYIGQADIDRNAPLSPHMQELFRPVYARALELYASTDRITSIGAASALSVLYERGWLVPKDPNLHILLYNYVYAGQPKPTLPAPGTASAPLPPGAKAPILAARSASPSESTSDPLFIDSNDYNANEDAYFYLTKSTLPTDKPLSPQSQALLQPVFGNLVRIYNASIGGMSARTSYTLALFYERGWIVPRDPAFAKQLLHYGSFTDARPTLTGFTPAPSVSPVPEEPPSPRSPTPTESTTQPLYIASNDERANEDAYAYLLLTTIPTDKPLSAQLQALYRPVFDNTLRIFNHEVGGNSSYAGYLLSVFYERGWIVAKNMTLAKKLQDYNTSGQNRPTLTGLP